MGDNAWAPISRSLRKILILPHPVCDQILHRRQKFCTNSGVRSQNVFQPGWQRCSSKATKIRVFVGWTDQLVRQSYLRGDEAMYYSMCLTDRLLCIPLKIVPLPLCDDRQPLISIPIYRCWRWTRDSLCPSLQKGFRSYGSRRCCWNHCRLVIRISGWVCPISRRIILSNKSRRVWETNLNLSKYSSVAWFSYFSSLRRNSLVIFEIDLSRVWRSRIVWNDESRTWTLPSEIGFEQRVQLSQPKRLQTRRDSSWHRI